MQPGMITQLPLITPREISILNQKWRVQNNLHDVTRKQVDACHLMYDHQVKANIWVVDSATDPDTNYRPRWTPEYGYQCTCRSGQEGFANCRNPSKVCWHVRAYVVAEREQSDERRIASAILSAQQAKAVLYCKTATETDREMADFALLEAKSIMHTVLMQNAEYASMPANIQSVEIDTLLFSDDSTCDVCGAPSTRADVEGARFLCDTCN